MRKKLKGFLTDVIAGFMLLLLLCTFVLCFIFVEIYFLTCVWVGILATIGFAALFGSKEIVCE